MVESYLPCRAVKNGSSNAKMSFDKHARAMYTRTVHMSQVSDTISTMHIDPATFSIATAFCWHREEEDRGGKRLNETPNGDDFE